MKPKASPLSDKSTEKFNLFAKKVQEQISETEDEDDPVRSKSLNYSFFYKLLVLNSHQVHLGSFIDL